MIQLVIFFGLITTVLCLFHYLVHNSRTGRLINKLPGAYAWPIIGNMGTYMVPVEQLWNVAHMMNEKYYPIQRLWSSILPVVHVFHPDDVEVVLTDSKSIEKNAAYKFLHRWLSTGLLTSGGKKWHQRRKILTPAFHFGVLQQFVAIFMEQSDKLVESLCPDGEEVVDDLVSLLHTYTLNSICETAMGSASSVDSEAMNEYRSSVSEMSSLFMYRLVRPWLYFDWSFRWCKLFVNQCRALKVLHQFSTNIIKERQEYHKDTDGQYLEGLGTDESIYGPDKDHATGVIDSKLMIRERVTTGTTFVSGDPHQLCDFGVELDYDCVVTRKRRLAMLDLLISASQKGARIDDEGIREEVDTFVFAGHDTTAMGLCFALLLLAENKEIQDKVRSEVDEVFAEKKGDQFTIRDIQRMCYLERCIKETFRLFPPVPLIGRAISEDLQLKNYLIPGGTIVNVFISQLHRDPNFWPNPTVFDPDRFLPEQTRGRHPFAYVPFSAGPRNCIGQKFAMIEMKALIGNILHKFYLEPIDLSSEVRMVADLVLRPFDPVRIKFVPRSLDG